MSAAPSSASPAWAVELVGIDKRFGPVHANRDVTLRFAPSSIHGLVGENGAGKSTLMSILYGFYEADAGEILVRGKQVDIRTPQDAIRLGIGMVHQHFMLVETFTVLENLLLGHEGGPVLGPAMARARTEVQALEQQFGLEVPLDALVCDLPVGVQQRVEILKALYRGADVLILDEPTAVLSPPEVEQLFRILERLRQQGRTVLLITHKLKEIMAITDRVSVLRRGQVVAEFVTAETDRQALADAMVGRKTSLSVDKAPAKPGPVLLAAQNLNVVDARGVTTLKDACLTVRAGEIVGIAGVAGNGQSELLEVLSGMCRFVSGTVTLKGEDIGPATQYDAADARRRGVAHVPEDRLKLAVIKDFPAHESAILGYHQDKSLSKGWRLDWKRTIAKTVSLMEQFDVRPPNPNLRTALFSGGNQQKLVMAREMEREPDILLVGQPTRGVDIGAIAFIHRQLVSLRDRGKAILLVSAELDEILALSDRILVMCDGEIVGELSAAEATEGRIGTMMAGIKDSPTAEGVSA
ncbi:heme ABC transporter ATP-binding protein [Niveispirillum lacus]|uniref:Heme ABC transporter ATP-binding protein n=1 Tax=Niveispirillum lacus TaxID=1981099 RepID=A0A255Z284_9PROT|nr:ABC transporter ATP-binding protein [Niveispirillum lacus]OYQ35588.1 heme ABC transporter ATP-binding protein [Niveispirillum lacus]